MSDIPPKMGLKARVVMELEFDDGTKTTIEMHKLEIGPQIMFYDRHRDEFRETGLEYNYCNETTDEIEEPSIMTVKRPGREFIEINLLALASPAEHAPNGEHSRWIEHSKTEPGTDPYSLMLGRKS